MPAPPDPRPDTGSRNGRPYPRVVPHSGKIFEPFLPILSPERPRPADTSAFPTALLLPKYDIFSIPPLPLPVVMAGHAAASGNV